MATEDFQCPPVIQLSVNLNKVALVRNARPEIPVDMVEIVERCLLGGAGGITLHPRPDLRHILPADVDVIGDCLVSHQAELNIEGNPFARPRNHVYPGLLALVARAGAQQCTLVPDTDDQATSDHGWDFARDGRHLKRVVRELQAMGVRVSLFVDPDPAAMLLAAETGAERVELYTGPYALAQLRDPARAKAVLQQHADTALAAAQAGLGVNAGHDLNLDNLQLYAERVEGLLEVSIGHALTLDAVRIGLQAAVACYSDLLKDL